MEKIDELFEKSLKNLEISPSERANKLFESRLAQKNNRKRKGWFYFGMAASLSLFGVITLSLFLKTNKKQDTVASSTSVFNSEIEKSQLSNIEEAKSGLFKEKISDNSVFGQKHFLIEKKISKNIFQSESTSDPINANTVSATQEMPIARIMDSQNTITKTDLNLSEKENFETLVILSPLLSINPETIAQAIQAPKTQTVTQEQEYFTDDKSLFVRMAEEVKNIKKGEKVDFNKLGIRPLEDWSKDEDGFIASETREFKERYTRIKTFLSSK